MFKLTVGIAPQNFDQWQELHTLLTQAYAYMDQRVNPPTSMHRLSIDGLKAKADEETLILAKDGERILGCLFAKPEIDHLYVGKLAVANAAQGKGVGKHLLSFAEQVAKQYNLSRLKLFTRIELIENQAAFQKCGFQLVGHGTHKGFNAPTYVVMEKQLIRR